MIKTFGFDSEWDGSLEGQATVFYIDTVQSAYIQQAKDVQDTDILIIQILPDVILTPEEQQILGRLKENGALVYVKRGLSLLNNLLGTMYWEPDYIWYGDHSDMLDTIRGTGYVTHSQADEITNALLIGDET